jgi:hypothetical protein
MMRGKATRDVAELARLRSRVDYWSKKNTVERPKDVLLVLSTELRWTTTIRNQEDVRVGQDHTTPLYRVGNLARLLGKSVQTIRLWERQGVIPDSGITLMGKKSGATRQRGYTYDQLRTVYELLPFIDFSDIRGERYTVFSRELWRAWRGMPDGVKPEHQPEPTGLEEPSAKKLKGRPRRRISSQ